MSTSEYDVIVIGGGPGGSAVGTLVAKDGHRVLLLERESFPRHQIGESLLPATIHFLCELLGVKEDVEKAGFMRKLGGSFLWGKSAKPWSFNFGATPALAGPNAYAYQVRRAEFDQLLLRNAARCGVHVRERCAATELIMDGERVVGVRFTDETGAAQEARARYVVDASGNTTRLARAVGERVYSKYFQNVALYAYYEGGKRLPEPHTGSIYCAAFDEGWFWYIPLSPTVTSVGVVVDKKHAELLKQGPEAAMQRFIAKCPSIADFLSTATASHGRHVRRIQGPTRLVVLSHEVLGSRRGARGGRGLLRRPGLLVRRPPGHLRQAASRRARSTPVFAASWARRRASPSSSSATVASTATSTNF